MIRGWCIYLPMQRWIGVGTLLLTLCHSEAAFLTRTQVRMVLSAESAKPGDTVVAGIQLRMPPGWHTYWKNPGDSGQATKIEWLLPQGITNGATDWPIPEKLITTAGPLTLVTYVYHDETVLLVPLKIPTGMPEGPVELRAKLSWQECEKQCFPGKGEVQATLVVGKISTPSRDVAMIEAWQKRLPRRDGSVIASASWEKPSKTEERPLLIEWKTEVRPVDFFPYLNDLQGTTEVLQGPRLRLRKVVKNDEGKWPVEVAGILVERPGTPQAVAYEVTLPLRESANAASVPAPRGTASASLVGMLGLAFLGGLILNIMPCVLPVIALKVLGFVNQSRETPGRIRQLGLVYALGVLVSFLILAGIAVGVQRAGSLAGWGMAFQNPQFRLVITLVIFLVALNLFGIFEINLGGHAMSAAGELTAQQGAAGAFFNGVLATVLATPCTAPFLGTAIGFAFTQPPALIVLIFVFVGLGLAAPFVLLCWQPGWLRFLPRPGLWMVRFKVAMGFPMMATAVWLFWVTATRLGKSGVLWLGLFLVVVAMAAWVWGEFVQKGARRKTLAVVVSLFLVGSAYGFILEKQLHWRTPGQASPDGIVWQPWSAEAVRAAQAEGKPVFVDFTADTCLNCKYFEATSINTSATRAKFRELNFATFVADYTDENPRIAAELKRYGSGGVPMYLIYPKRAGEEPTVMTSLTQGSLIQALENAGK